MRVLYLRVPDEVYDSLAAEAELNGETLTAAGIAALREALNLPRRSARE